MKFSNIKPDRIKKFLVDRGFKLANVDGSHFYYKNDGHLVCVVDHSNHELGYKSIGAIIRQSGIDRKEWRDKL